MNLFDFHREAWQLADQLHDGPHADRVQEIKDWLTNLVPDNSAPEKLNPDLTPGTVNTPTSAATYNQPVDAEPDSFRGTPYSTNLPYAGSTAEPAWMAEARKAGWNGPTPEPAWMRDARLAGWDAPTPLKTDAATGIDATTDNPDNPANPDAMYAPKPMRPFNTEPTIKP